MRTVAVHKNKNVARRRRRSLLNSATIPPPRLVNNPLNIGASEPWSVRHLAEEIVAAFGMKGVPQLVDARKTDVKITYCDTSKARKLFGYEAKVSVAEGLRLTVDWVKQQGIKEFRYTDYREIPKLEHAVYIKKSI